MGLYNNHAASRLKRILIIICVIKDAKGRASVKEIDTRLKGYGIVVSMRTVQRDLQSMQELGVPVYGDKCNPQGWCIDTKNPLSRVVGGRAMDRYRLQRLADRKVEREEAKKLSKQTN